MPTDKQTVLANAPYALNHSDQPWEITIQGDTIIAYWRWMDARFFAPAEVNDDVRQYTFSVTLKDNGKWTELDKTMDANTHVGAGGGKIGFGMSKSGFRGKTNRKSFTIGIGTDNQTGESGVIAFKFNTTLVKEPIRNYLTNCGWKKAGLFG